MAAAAAAAVEAAVVAAAAAVGAEAIEMNCGEAVTVATDSSVANSQETIPSGLLLQWHVTNRCNLRCAHCYQSSYAGTELSFAELQSVLRNYERLLEHWRAKAGRRVWGHITVTGGEPFVRSDFLEFLELLSVGRDRYSFAVLTNGSLIDRVLARRLRGLRPRFVQVSLEGAEDTHDGIRGSGDFQRTVTALEHLVRFGVPTMVSFTAHRGNFREFPIVARLASKLGVRRVWSDRLIPFCATDKGLASASLSPEETRDYVTLLTETKRDVERRWFNRTEVATHRALQFLCGGENVYRCTAGDSLLTLMPNGDVYPCRRMPLTVGNVHEQSLDEIYRSSPLLRQLRNDASRSSECQSCPHGARCRGGLRCLAHAVTGDPFARDPGCWLPAS